MGKFVLQPLLETRFRVVWSKSGKRGLTADFTEILKGEPQRDGDAVAGVTVLGELLLDAGDQEQTRVPIDQAIGVGGGAVGLEITPCLCSDGERIAEAELHACRDFLPLPKLLVGDRRVVFE